MALLYTYRLRLTPPQNAVTVTPPLSSSGKVTKDAKNPTTDDRPRVPEFTVLGLNRDPRPAAGQYAAYIKDECVTPPANAFTQFRRRQKLWDCYLLKHMSFAAKDLESIDDRGAQSTTADVQH